MGSLVPALAQLDALCSWQEGDQWNHPELGMSLCSHEHISGDELMCAM
jgi:hypothetical protein